MLDVATNTRRRLRPQAAPLQPPPQRPEHKTITEAAMQEAIDALVASRQAQRAADMARVRFLGLAEGLGLTTAQIDHVRLQRAIATTGEDEE